MTLKHGSFHKSLIPLPGSSLNTLPLMINLSHLLFPKGRKGIAEKSGKTDIYLTPPSKQYGKLRQKFEIPLRSCASQYRGGKVVANCRTQFQQHYENMNKPSHNPAINQYPLQDSFCQDDQFYKCHTGTCTPQFKCIRAGLCHSGQNSYFTWL